MDFGDRVARSVLIKMRFFFGERYSLSPLKLLLKSGACVRRVQAWMP